MSAEASMRPHASVVDLRTALQKVGRSGEDDYFWRRQRDLYTVTLAELLLKRTTRPVVRRVLPLVLERYPDPSSLAEARDEDIWQIVAPTGLRSRVHTLKEVARLLAMAGHDFRPDDLLSVKGVGKYVRDAVALYVFDEPTLPTDSTVQRVVWRAFWGKHLDRRPREPYSDALLQEAVKELIKGEPPGAIRHLHQGALDVGWAYCKSKAVCKGCPLRGHCALHRVQGEKHGQETRVASQV